MKYNNHTIYYDKKGYAIIWLNGTNKKVHILEWEKHNGEKPNGSDVHHLDGDKSNWNIKNLQPETKSDHLKIHAGWVRKNGKWILKPCKDCKKLLPLDGFYQRKGLTPSQRCIKCSAPYFKEKSLVPGFKERRKLYMAEYYKKNKDKFV